MTVPEAAAWPGVPLGTPMSIPACRRQTPPRQRYPKPLVTGPDTGQIRPLDDSPVPEDPDPDDPCAWICAASEALAASCEARSSSSCRRVDLTLTSSCSLLARIAASALCWETSSSRADCTAAVFFARTAVAAATWVFVRAVCSRA